MKKIIVDLKIFKTRLLFFICYLLIKNNFKVYLFLNNVVELSKNNPEHRYFDYLKDLDVVFINEYPSNGNNFYLMTNHDYNKNSNFIKVYFINDYFFPKDKIRSAISWPYFMHPDIYYHKVKSNLSFTKIRKNKILYLNYPVHGDYGIPYNDFYFKKINRLDLINFLVNKFNSKIFLLTSDCSYYINPHKICLKNYLSYVSEFNFYLCLPGFKMPFSHNVIEAMSVGTIPVLQYPELFDPPLINGINCISYSNFNDLIEINSMVKSLSMEQILFLRSNVIKYYNNHLNINLIGNNLFSQKEKLVFFNVVNEKIASNLSKVPLNFKKDFFGSLRLLFNRKFLKYVCIKIKFKYF